MANDQTNQTVDEIDKARRQYFARSPDRPCARVRTRSQQPKEVVRAKDRLKTAAWRDQNDKLKRPEGAAAAMQFLVSTLPWPVNPDSMALRRSGTAKSHSSMRSTNWKPVVSTVISRSPSSSVWRVGQNDRYVGHYPVISGKWLL
jgi:hypothetical protein